MIITALFFMVSGACLVGALAVIAAMVACDSKLSRQSYKRLDKAIMLLFLGILWSLILAVISLFIFKSV